MSDLLTLNVLYRLPTDGQPIYLDDLAAILKSAGLLCTRIQIAASLGTLCDQGMAVCLGQDLFSRADLCSHDDDDKLSFAELMAKIATRLIHNDSESLAERITDALRYVAQFTGADRAYVFEYDFGHNMACYRYEWCAAEIGPRSHFLSEFPMAVLEEDVWVASHQRGESVTVNDIAELINPDFRQAMMVQGIKSMIAVPIMADAQCLGFIGFDSVRYYRQYGEEDVHLLETLSRMLTNLHWKEADRLALARVHDNLDIIVEGAGVGTWVWWMDTGRMEVNEIWANMLGYARQDLEPVTIETWECLTHPDDLDEANKLVCQYLDGRLEYYDTQLRMRHRAGHWVQVQARARLIQRDPAEGPVMVGVHHDVTELEQTYRELRLLSEVINRSPVVASRWRDEPGYPVEYISQTVARFGYKSEEFISGNTKYHELIHPDDLRSMQKEHRDFIDEAGAYQLIYRLRHRQGHWIWIEETGWSGNDQDGKEINCVLLDITQRKLLEQKLKLHATLANNSVDVIVLIGPDLRYRIANQGYLNIVGKSIDEVVGRTKSEIFGRSLPDEYFDVFEDNLQRALKLERGESMVIEELIPDIKGGPERTFRSRYFPVFDELTNEFRGIALLAVEITDLKLAQAALTNSEHRFRELFENLPVAITMHDPETGEILEANNLACRFHEVKTLEQLRKINIWDQPEPFSKKDALAWNRKAVHEGGQSFEWRSINPAGRVFWQSVTLEPIQIDGILRILAASIDINEKVLARQALARSEARFRGLLENLPNVAVQGYDCERRITFWNKGSEMVYGYSASEAMGNDLSDLLAPEAEKAWFRETIDRWIAEEITMPSTEMVLCNKQGLRKSVFSSHIFQHPPSGEVEFYCIDVDLTEQKLAQQRLELLARVFIHSYDGVIITDKHAVLIEVNDRYCEMTGYSRAELLGQKPLMVLSDQYDDAFYAEICEQLEMQGYWIGEIRNRKKSGERYSLEVRITVLTDSDGKVVNYIANVTDITERMDYEEKLRHIAFHDPLTGLANRSSVSETLRQSIAKFKYRDVPFAVVFIDLDEFKAINDSYGHEMGDRYLQSVASRLRSILRAGDIAARFGGDEFVLILKNQKPATPSGPAFDRLLAAMHDPVMIDGKTLRLTASFGVTFYPQESEIDADQLLRQADQAMYSAKQHGKNRIVYFDAEFERSIILRNARIAELRLAIENGEMLLHYQPQVNMSTGRVLGVEALIRWNHPKAGLLYPEKFLDLIQEDEQLGLALSKWVLTQSLSDLERIRALGHVLRISVNTVIPAEESLRAIFLDNLHDVLQQHVDTPPELLTLEVVENILIDDLSEATRTINRIQQLGVQISLDDFGTGFSSLSHLKHLSFNELKIDQEFVRGMLGDRENMTIVQAVVSLSQSFDVSVIGEGVETGCHAEMLLRLGCLRAQGYAISPPLAIDALEVWLGEWKPDPAWQHVAPIPPHFYQIIASLSGYAGWVMVLEQYLHGHATEVPAWDWPVSGLSAQLQSSAETRDLWHKAREYERLMGEAGWAAIDAFRKTGPGAESERHLNLVTEALESLQKLVWSRLDEAT